MIILRVPKGEKPQRCPYCGTPNISGSQDQRQWDCNLCGRGFGVFYVKQPEPERVRRIRTPDEIDDWRRRQLAEDESLR